LFGEEITVIASEPTFAPFVKQKTVRLTTFRRDGTPVGTAVNLAVDPGDARRAFFRTYDKAGKAKRLRNNPEVEIAPSTMKGEATGAAMHARARLLNGEEAKLAARLISRKHPLLQGIMVRWGHPLMRYKTLHYEVTPEDGVNDTA
jgi:PPOX class probable F420-dependent enzyme